MCYFQNNVIHYTFFDREPYNLKYLESDWHCPPVDKQAAGITRWMFRVKSEQLVWQLICTLKTFDSSVWSGRKWTMMFTIPSCLQLCFTLSTTRYPLVSVKKSVRVALHIQCELCRCSLMVKIDRGTEGNRGTINQHLSKLSHLVWTDVSSTSQRHRVWTL